MKSHRSKVIGWADWAAALACVLLANGIVWIMVFH